MALTKDYEWFKKAVFDLTKIDLDAYKEKQMKRRIDNLIMRNKAKDYEVYVEHNASGFSSFNGREIIAQGHLDGIGYFTVRTDAGSALEKGERFAVLVKITTRGVTKPVAVELCKDSFTENVTLAGKEGFVSAEGIVWDETETVYGANVCLKAYTDIVE